MFVFSGIGFIFRFFPIFLIAYYAVPARFRNTILLIGSIVFYVTMLFLIHKGYLTAFTIATFLEIIAHMVLAIIFTGWGAGFQITIIGIVILLFFCEYVARSLNIAYVRSIYLVPIAAAAYLSSFIVTLQHD